MRLPSQLLKASIIGLIAVMLNLLPIVSDLLMTGSGRCLAATCPADHDMDGDTDGADVAAIAMGNLNVSLVAGSFGSQDCDKPDGVELIGSEGGSIQTADNIIVSIPAGALSEPTFIGVSALNPQNLSINAPATFSFAAGITLFTGGAVFDIPVQVTLPPTPELDEGQQVAVVQAGTDIDQDGANDWLLVDRAFHQNGLIETQSEHFPGLAGGGNFAFLISDAPFAYVALTGIVGAEAPASMAYSLNAAQPSVGSGMLVCSDYPGIGSPVIDGRSIAMVKPGFDAYKAILVVDLNNDNVFGLHTF